MNKEIKVGQIYLVGGAGLYNYIKKRELIRQISKTGFMVTISNNAPVSVHSTIAGSDAPVCGEGYVETHIRHISELDRKNAHLIGEYPTWQEAFNSREFRGEK